MTSASKSLSGATDSAGSAAGSGGGHSGIFCRLAEEHAELADMMGRIAGTIEVPVRQELFPRIRRGLLAHLRSEEEVLYAHLTRHPDLSDLVAQSVEEHAAVERYLKRLDVKDKSTKQWGDLFAEMLRVVERHVDREERELFSRARDVLDPHQAREMSDRYDDMDGRDDFR